MANIENESNLKDQIDQPQINLTRILILFRNMPLFILPVFTGSPSNIQLG